VALSRKKATTIALDPEDDRLLSRAARERGVSRSEFIRQHLALVLEQYRRHPRPRSAGIVRRTLHVPIIMAGRPVAVIVFATAGPRAYDEHDLVVMSRTVPRRRRARFRYQHNA